MTPKNQVAWPQAGEDPGGSGDNRGIEGDTDNCIGNFSGVTCLHNPKKFVEGG
jgi:hypothetical protein